MNDQDSVPSESEETNETEKLRLQVMRLCHDIPQGRVSSYGAIGAQCDPPVSGYICGRIMGQVMEGVPWWRIVGKDGNLPISKRGPNKSREQRERLENEGVEFDDNEKIERRFFVGESHTGDQGSLF